ncbi:MAG: hypothetical protein K2X38_13810 [Gemmataceae bacterium]|nr:hypothetical protein [Gemmataceae bacterium]
MNRVQQNEVDAVLTGFFKSQMPSPWPKANLELAAPSTRAPRAGGSLTHARLVLAASVLFLVFGFLGMSKHFQTEPQDGVTAVEHIANKPGPNGALRAVPKVQKNKELPR